MNVFSGHHHKIFICRCRLNSYTSKKILLIHKPKVENNDKTTIRNSLESNIHWKNHFQKNPMNFRIYAGFEADNEIDNSSIGNKTTDIYKQNALLKNYHKLSDLEDVLKVGITNLL